MLKLITLPAKANLMNKTPEQIAAIVAAIMQDEPQTAVHATPQPYIPPNPPEDFIQSTMTYEHETPPQSINSLNPNVASVPNATFSPPVTEAYQPVIQPVVEPTFLLNQMEPDLAELIRYCVQEKKQTLYTPENVFLQQCLRVIQRLEEKVTHLEEVIHDELIGGSTDNEPEGLIGHGSNTHLTFQEHPSAEEEKIDWVEDEATDHQPQLNTRQPVQTDSKPSEGQRKKPRQRRRRKRNRKN